ncbi:UvrD-like helicase family protein [Leucobacter luti]|uniref:DNA 3'-5' helicase n=2 Tax=Leucobacter luti TaxID=340320 RepID=A0A4Q7U7S7_9MICO|nr:DNA helicase UvrD [Leucobacter luti]RZT68860.1 UvrD-like helicase family protein [Leucobacter luti]
MTKVRDQHHEKDARAKILSFLTKLTEDDTSVGLHIEKMVQAADKRARTGRVDLGLRAVLYLLETGEAEKTYVYAGTWEHDEAIARAKSRVLRVNPVNGVAELIDVGAPKPALRAPQDRATPGHPAEPTRAPAPPVLVEREYRESDLVDELGLTPQLAAQLMAAATAEDILQLADTMENEWQSAALLGLAVGDAVHKIRQDLGFGADAEPENTADGAERTEDEELVRSLAHPASQMQFNPIDGADELRRAIEGQDFSAWRVFLHPEQRKYATRPYNGAFRLSGGAGTGKTVVLLHRANHLQQQNPQARILLTTFTRALAANLSRDLERLNPEVSLTDRLGEAGVQVRGIDALAASVRDRAMGDFGDIAQQVLGHRVDRGATYRPNSDGWKEAVQDVDTELPPEILHPTFFEAEYLQVILPQRLTTREAYLTVRRPGRGVALDRKKRAQVWSIVQHYRDTARALGRLSFAEVAEIGAAWLERERAVAGDGSGLADHVLVDEGQDLTPSHWKLLRAIVPVGPNDLFIAEDSHQRIYGHQVILSRYGIRIVGRSRRLTLNYRTTEQNLRFALGVLDGAEYQDSESGEEGLDGYRSARLGPRPVLRPAPTDAAQYDQAAELLREWDEQGVDPGTVAILVRTNKTAQLVRQRMDERGVETVLLTAAKRNESRPVVLTMNTAKGMEFSHVLLFDVSLSSMPLAWLTDRLAVEEANDLLLRERSLLYVAASRARDVLAVSWKGDASTLLSGAQSLGELG